MQYFCPSLKKREVSLFLGQNKKASVPVAPRQGCWLVDTYACCATTGTLAS